MRASFCFLEHFYIMLTSFCLGNVTGWSFAFEVNVVTELKMFLRQDSKVGSEQIQFTMQTFEEVKVCGNVSPQNLIRKYDTTRRLQNLHSHSTKSFGLSCEQAIFQNGLVLIFCVRKPTHTNLFFSENIPAISSTIRREEFPSKSFPVRARKLWQWVMVVARTFSCRIPSCLTWYFLPSLNTAMRPIDAIMHRMTPLPTFSVRQFLFFRWAFVNN